jgi:hypothetical protein
MSFMNVSSPFTVLSNLLLSPQPNRQAHASKKKIGLDDIPLYPVEGRRCRPKELTGDQSKAAPVVARRIGDDERSMNSVSQIAD